MNLPRSAKPVPDTRVWDEFGRLQCTACKVFKHIAGFKLIVTRGKHTRSRWCSPCHVEYQQQYYLTRFPKRKRALTLVEQEAIASDPRKGLAAAMDFGVSLSTVYKLKALARRNKI